MLLSVPPAAAIVSSCGQALTALRERTTEIAQLQGPKTFASVILPLESAMNETEDALALDRFAATVSDDHDTREASIGCSNDADRAIADVEASPALYATAIIAAKTAKNPIDRRLAHVWLIHLKRAGAAVAPQYREEFLARRDELSDLQLRYAIAPSPALFERAIAVRDRLAHLLGYQSWAAYRLSDTLARTPARVASFLAQVKTAPQPTDGTLFSAAHTVDTALDVVATLLGIEFRKEDGDSYQVIDRDSQSELGRLYVILRTHACESACIVRASLPPRAVAIVVNLERPTRRAPATVTHTQVARLFHELGAAVSALLAATPYRTLDDALPADFSDAPAQVFEELAWQPPILEKLSSRGKADATAPIEIDAAEIDGATFDLHVHNGGDRVSPDELQKISGTVLNTLMNGHDARLYATLWARQYAAQVFSAFASDPLDPETGARFRSTVLAPAGSQDSLTEIANFLGHDPSASGNHTDEHDVPTQHPRP